MTERILVLADSTFDPDGFPRVFVGESHWSDSPVVIATGGLAGPWVEPPATLTELQVHASRRYLASSDAAMASRATLTGNEHLTAKELGEE